MKEDNGDQGVGATAFDYPNSQNPKPHAKPFYGNQRVPKPCNHEAMKTPREAVMSAVLDAE